MKNIIILTFMANCVFTSVHKKENQEAIYRISRDPLKNSTLTYTYCTIYIYIDKLFPFTCLIISIIKKRFNKTIFLLTFSY